MFQKGGATLQKGGATLQKTRTEWVPWTQKIHMLFRRDQALTGLGQPSNVHYLIRTIPELNKVRAMFKHSS